VELMNNTSSYLKLKLCRQPKIFKHRYLEKAQTLNVLPFLSIQQIFINFLLTVRTFVDAKWRHGVKRTRQIPAIMS
jgi:hypothetical protein